MTADIENLVLEHLRAIRGDIADLKNRMTGVELEFRSFFCKPLIFMDVNFALNIGAST